MKPEAKFTKEIQESLHHMYNDRAYFFKIPDAPRPNIGGMCGKCKGQILGMLRFTPKRPFDLMLVIDGTPICIELKYHAKHTAWPLKCVNDNQIDNLVKAKKANCEAYVLVKMEHTQEAYKIDIDEFLLAKETKKSIKLDNMIGEKMIRSKYNGRLTWLPAI